MPRSAWERSGTSLYLPKHLFLVVVTYRSPSPLLCPTMPRPTPSCAPNTGDAAPWRACRTVLEETAQRESVSQPIFYQFLDRMMLSRKAAPSLALGISALVVAACWKRRFLLN